MGKADVVREVMGTYTGPASAAVIQALMERFLEITSGRSCGPAVGGLSGKDPPNEPQEAKEAGGHRTGT